ncbi:fused MFS/spermidine synthase [Rhodoferax lacus]|uniref:fused MFS/spermidine synthase n=1 Tax=Rhodoferax lacus TaxID=2184758 RepID=UPI001F3134E6|nr:fused MFS/spermidine synthase [Rhodoferax lacus]
MELLPPGRSAHAAQRLAMLLMGASGFASLAYQIVWTQQCAVWLGHETAAVLAVVAAFFGGLALGAWALGPRVARSAQPARWYVACELTIAAWSVALALLMAPLGGWLVTLAGTQPDPAWQWATAFMGTFVLLLPATVAMGATLPAMERVVGYLRADGHSIAMLYASNTVGAVLGVLAAAFWLVPELGLVRTTLLCAALNAVCAAGAWGLRFDGSNRGEPLVPTGHGGRLVMLLALTGLLGIGYEVLVVRVLSQVAENTVYTFAMLLAVYLAGTAIGAAVYQRWLAGTQAPDRLRNQLLCALAASSLLATCALWGVQELQARVREALQGGMAAAIAAEAAMALAAFALPTLVMGALFSHLTTQARSAGVPFGRALAFNTLGAAAAPLLFGVLLAPAIGPKFALLMVAAGYLVLALPDFWKSPLVWGPAVATMALMVWAPSLAFVDVPEGGHVVSYRDGAMAAVSVVEDAQGAMRLRIDNRQQEGSSNSLLADARQALLPLLLHPAPRRALFLGLGTGVTSASATAEPGLEVDVVELLPEVIAASDSFTRALTGGVPHPRLHVMVADARRFVRASQAHYDVVVSDNFHPARSGSGALYTVEHFQAVRERLAEGGLFCQWLPLHQLDLQTLRAIVQSFVTVYPGGWAMLATNSLDTPTIGLVGRADARRFDASQVHARVASARWPQPPAAFGLSDEFAVLGSFIAGPESLARFADGSRANTDDRPVVAYGAPRITYAPDSLPRDRLVELLQELVITPAGLLGTDADAVMQKRMAAYWAARTRYIDIGRGIRPSGDVRRMLMQVQDPLLSVLRISPDFRPAYDPLLQMATALGQSDAPAASVLLKELQRLQPSRPEAAQALSELN